MTELFDLNCARCGAALRIEFQVPAANRGKQETFNKPCPKCGTALIIERQPNILADGRKAEFFAV